MNTDADLLRRYVHDRDEPAFTELVQRHLRLVYAVALRRVGGDTHLAQDVTQRVFSVLARKASTLVGRPTLSGWLYTSAHLTSAAVVRGERRRKMHETEAQLMQTTLSPSEPAADWTRLRPVIDDVIVALREEDREAIALRFFEKRSFVEVGIALRVTEEAARKRVDRALEKLRAMLEQRGITSTTAALGIALPACAVAHSPAGLGGTVARQALANASAKTLLGTIARTLWPAAAVLVVGSLVLVSQRRSNDALHTELMARVAGKSALETLRAENQQLTKSIASVPAPAPPRNDVAARILFTGGQEGRIRTARPNDTTVTFGPTITIDASRALVWNTDYINLDEFKRRLNELHDHNPKAIILIRSVSKRNGEAVKYAIEQARQAKIQTSLSEDALDVSWWF